MKTLTQEPAFRPIASIARFLLIGTACAFGCIHDSPGDAPNTDTGENKWVKAEVHRLDSYGQPMTELWNYDQAGQLVSADERILSHFDEVHRLATYEYGAWGVESTFEDYSLFSETTTRLTTRFLVNTEGRLDEVTTSSDTLSTGTRYVYDHLGRLIETVDSDGSSRSVTYVGANITEQYFNGQLLYSYQYDARDRMLSADPGEDRSTMTSFKYDDTGRLSLRLTQSDSQDAAYATDFAYGANGRLKNSFTRSSEDYDQLVSENHFEYDESNRLTWRSRTNSLGSVFEEFLSYDALGRPAVYERWQYGELFMRSTREWRVVSENEIDVEITGDDGSVKLIVYRRLTSNPQTPPTLPVIRTDFPDETPSFEWSYPLRN